MLISLCIYILFLFILALHSYKKTHKYSDFALAGQQQNSLHIAFSLLASTIGGSALFGLTDLTKTLGFAAFWWLGLGAIVLFLQSSILTKKVRALNAYSLPHVARITLNKKFSLLVSFAIVFSWIGIIAAQFAAIANIISLISLDYSKEFFIILSAIIVIIYTFLGGQLSVIKTDVYQFILLFTGIMFVFFLFYFTDFGLHKNFAQSHINFDKLLILQENFKLFNASFNGIDFIKLLLLVGLPYFIGPDIFSRILSAKDEESAKKGVRLAAILLLLFAFFLTSISIWALEHDSISTNTLLHIMSHYLPLPLTIILVLGIISALISSADTCLMSVVTILEHDILQEKSINRSRAFIILIGLFSLIFALYHQDIIPMLLSAYSIYVPGVVIPLFFGIMFYNKKVLNSFYIYAALLVGGGLGVIASFSKISDLSILGIAFSLVFSLCSLYFAKPIVASENPELDSPNNTSDKLSTKLT